jgi:dihydroorotate dehydrogenase
MMQPKDVERMMEAGASLVALNTGLRENGFRLLKKASRAVVESENRETKREEK